MNRPQRVGLIGFGAVGRALAEFLSADTESARIEAVALRDPEKAGALGLPESVRVLQTPEELAAIPLDLVVECAGHGALRQFGPTVLRQGCDLLLASVGALADAELEAGLRDASRSTGARVLFSSGALGGLDVLSAARIAGLDDVTYTGRKLPCAWRGTAAEDLIDLYSESVAARPFFEGNARAAALTFPQNANVTAAVAVAGKGFDSTRVQLFADPEAQGNEHRIKASGRFGEFETLVRARTLPDNPKTSMLAACSLARSIFNRNAQVALS